jgi:mitotic spindle assembly checkpoint protein MAD2B
MAALPPKPQQLNTYNSLLTSFTDFLIVAIHTILYERSLYPPQSFLLTRAYNFPVRQNRHPEVCKWIIDAAAAVREQMLRGAVRRVVVVIYSDQNEVLERFVFDVERFPRVPEKEQYTEFEAEIGDDGEEVKVNRIDVEEQLRATIRKLAYCGGKLGELPEDCTYTVAVELKDKAEPPIGVSLFYFVVLHIFCIVLKDSSTLSLGNHQFLHYKQGTRVAVKPLEAI